MPVEEKTSSPFRQALMIGLGLIATLGVVIYAMNSFSSNGENTVQLEIAATAYELGTAKDLAEQVKKTGPSAFNDLAGGSITYFISHIGEDPEKNWYAFSATSNNDSKCLIEYVKEKNNFKETCSDQTYELTGEGLKQFLIEVNANGNLQVDLATAN